MIVRTISPCPACAESSQKNMLSYDTDSFKEGQPLPVFCSKGHAFPSQEDAEAYTAVLPQEPISAPETISSQSAPSAVPEPPQEAARPSLEPLEAVPEAVQQEIANIQVNSKLDQVTETIAKRPRTIIDDPKERERAREREWQERQSKVDVAPAPLPSIEEAITLKKAATATQAPPANGSFALPPGRVLPGGSMLVMVRVPEEHVSFLRGEAERQNEKVEDYFQRITEWGLQSRWYYIFVLAAFLFFGGPLRAQTAQVIALSPADSHEAQVKWQALQDSQKQWDDFQKRVAKDYTVVKSGDKDASGTQYFEPTLDTSITTFSGIATTGTFIVGTTSWPPDECYSRSSSHKEPESEKCKQQKEEYEKQLAKRNWYRQGWSDGFEFDKDFHFIVPKKSEPAKCQGLNCRVVLTPAIGGISY